MIDPRFSRYIGIPYRHGGEDFDGADCWRLCRMIWADLFGVVVPGYEVEEYVEGAEAELAAFIKGEVAKQWVEVSPGQERPGDAILFRIVGQPVHVGVVAGDGSFIHVIEGGTSELESYRGAKWKNRRLGFFRFRP